MEKCGQLIVGGMDFRLEDQGNGHFVLTMPDGVGGYEAVELDYMGDGSVVLSLYSEVSQRVEQIACDLRPLTKTLAIISERYMGDTEGRFAA